MVTAEQVTNNIIPAVYERPPAGPIRYAGLNHPAEAGVKDLYSAIFNRYVPRIPLKNVSQEMRAKNGWLDLPEEIITSKEWVETDETYQRATTRPDGVKVEAGDPKVELVEQKELTMVPDPDVIWVGRISDGLVWLGIVESRKRLKDFLHNVPSGETGTSARCTFIFERDGREFHFGPRLLDEEPGEITNSPQSIAINRDPNADLDLSAPRYEEQAFEPRIRRYPDFDLHYLKRGDKITFMAQGWPRPRTNGGEPWTMRFELRPPSEGPSHVRNSSGVDNTVRLI